MTLATIKMSHNKKMAKLTVVCPYQKILVGNKNELITDAHDLDGSLGHYAK